jgi:hypothetical protein
MKNQFYIIKREVYADKTFLFMLGYNHKRMIKFIYEVEERAVHLHSKAVGDTFIKEAHKYVDGVIQDVNKGMYDNIAERREAAIQIAAGFIKE